MNDTSHLYCFGANCDNPTEDPDAHHLQKLWVCEYDKRP
jgi:hypothetical protein